MINLAKNVWKIEDESYAKKVKFFRFIISGGLATSVNISLTVIFTELLNWWYLVSAGVAFLSAFSISFILQKFWSFRDSQTETIKKQAIIFFLTMICGLTLNSTIIYCLVEYFEIHYLLAQIISGIIIAIINFIVYERIIFKKSNV